MENPEGPLARVRELLATAPRSADHAACGVSARPCADCWRTKVLECVDPDACAGITPAGLMLLRPTSPTLCRPCAATWRCRLWQRHPRHVREYHVWVQRYPALAKLHSDQEAGAALLLALRQMIRRDVISSVWRRLGRELPDAVRHIVARPRSRRRQA
jgi:hypothetical protein